MNNSDIDDIMLTAQDFVGNMLSLVNKYNYSDMVIDSWATLGLARALNFLLEDIPQDQLKIRKSAMKNYLLFFDGTLSRYHNHDKGEFSRQKESLKKCQEIVAIDYMITYCRKQESIVLNTTKEVLEKIANKRNKEELVSNDLNLTNKVKEIEAGLKEMKDHFSNKKQTKSTI